MGLYGIYLPNEEKKIKGKSWILSFSSSFFRCFFCVCVYLFVVVWGELNKVDMRARRLFDGPHAISYDTRAVLYTFLTNSRAFIARVNTIQRITFVLCAKSTSSKKSWDRKNACYRFCFFFLLLINFLLSALYVCTAVRGGLCNHKNAMRKISRGERIAAVFTIVVYGWYWRDFSYGSDINLVPTFKIKIRIIILTKFLGLF